MWRNSSRNKSGDFVTLSVIFIKTRVEGDGLGARSSSSTPLGLQRHDLGLHAAGRPHDAAPAFVSSTSSFTS
ncbi:hypothetical protein EYF80_053631 [Liparis tanakae]|uniref:Uncharacterized protein n=1 Tax=Liparis tanakae TaxID=230148 RepID=A0A4Z2F785_9TELE|nr:hypothetical protein EYF80_053631 [Liparis tanakae]